MLETEKEYRQYYLLPWQKLIVIVHYIATGKKTKASNFDGTEYPALQVAASIIIKKKKKTSRME